jgi:hypothetical protein
VTRPSLALAVALAAVLLTGCGDDDDAGADPPSSTVAPARSAPAVATPSPGLASALADVRTIAPRLESYYRGGAYPRDLAGVLASLPKAEVKPSPGNRLGAYRYDPAAVEFVLCVENASGAYATYDTAPMALGEQGETGGCPDTGG